MASARRAKPACAHNVRDPDKLHSLRSLWQTSRQRRAGPPRSCFIRADLERARLLAALRALLEVGPQRARVATRIVDHLARAIEQHRRAALGVVARPLRQPGAV